MGVAMILVRGKHFRGSASWGVRGGGAPRMPENLRKFSKNFLKKIAKNELFLHIFQKAVTNQCLNFSRVLKKNIIFGEFLIKFSKIS